MKKSELRQLIREEIHKLNESVTIDKYISALKELYNAIKTESGVLSNDEIAKGYYQKALRLGIDNKFISNSVRLQLNKHNKQFLRFDKTAKEIFLDGIGIVLKSLKATETVNQPGSAVEFDDAYGDYVVETIKKVDGKFAVYPKKGGKRLGTHDSKKDAQKQLAAIEISKQKNESAEHFNTGLSGEEESDAEKNFNKHHSASMYGSHLGTPAEEETYDWDDTNVKIPGVQNHKYNDDTVKKGYEPVKKKQYAKIDPAFKDVHIDDYEHIDETKMKLRNLIRESTTTTEITFKGNITVKFKVTSDDTRIIFIPNTSSEIDKLDDIKSTAHITDIISTYIHKKLGIAVIVDKKYNGIGYSFTVDTDSLIGKL